MAERGKYRKVGFYRDPAGREVHGLKRRPHPDNRFYSATHTTKTFGTDPVKAVKKFRKWEDERAKTTVPLRVKYKPLADAVKDMEPWLSVCHESARNGLNINVAADEATFWETVAELLDKDRKLFAEKTGWPQIEWLDELQKPRPAMRLKDVVTFYANKKQTSKDERRAGRSAWAEFTTSFRQISEAQTLADIRQDHINQYNGFIHGRISKGEIESKTANSKLRRIKMILNYAIKKADELDKPQLRRVRDLCESFDKPNGNGDADRNIIITPADYHKLLTTAKACTLTGSGIDAELWYCLLLLSLNCCFTGADLQALKPQHVDLKRKTLVMRRPKNEWRGPNESPVRVCILWDRTVAAIRRYKLKRPHGLDTLFANFDHRKGRYGKLNARSTITTQFAKIAKLAKVDATLKILRSSGETAAIKGGADATHAAILMGHKIPLGNVTVKYVELHPDMVADATAAIEKIYFSQKKGTK